MSVKRTKVIISTITAAIFLFSFASMAFADFNPSLLIPDDEFNDVQTFSGAAGIQQFLSSKGSVLANTSPSFLLMLREPQISLEKSALADPEPNLTYLRSAAQLVWDASQMTGINPQVILVTMEKEQSLITGTFSNNSSLQTALDHAMGFNCPDSSGCSSTFGGFYYQLFGNFDAQGNHYIGAPASLMRSFNTPNGRGPMVDSSNSTIGSPLLRTSQVGDTILIENTQGPPNNAPATQEVTLGDSATAALYRYTPHVYNGNYNFWKFFTEWFKFQNGTLVEISGTSNIYIVNNGQMSQMPAFVMMSRGLNPSTVSVQQISQSDFSNYTVGPVYAPPDGTLIQIQGDQSGTYYVFEQGVKHPASQFVLSQRKMDPNNAFTVSSSDAALFQTGDQLTPADGTLLQSQGTPTIYVVQSGEIYALTAFTFKQYAYSFKNVVTVPASEISLYQNAGFMLPQNGTLVQLAGSPTVYQLNDGLLQPISGTVFNLYKYSFKNVNVLNAGELTNAQQGPFLVPPDATNFFVVNPDASDSYFYYKNGTTHSISAYVKKEREISGFVQLSAGEAAALTPGTPLPPSDGILIRGDASATIYVIQNGQKVALDYPTWVKTYHKKSAVVLPEAEVDSYPVPASSAQIQQ